jgi:hypothetical protein
VWGGVRYKDLYPGIDLEITGENGRLVQRLVARPGADLSAVRLRVEGADAVELAGGEGLHLTTTVGDFTLSLLTVEGATPDGHPANLGLSPAEILNLKPGTFDIASPFSLSSSLPFPAFPQDNPSDLLYATFLGGSDQDEGKGIAVDANGAAYVTGITHSSDFPTTPGSFDTDASFGIYWGDAFVVKIAPSGSALSYASFLGGNSTDYGYGIAVDSSGNAYVTGETWSPDFPTTVEAFDTTCGTDGNCNGGLNDAFVAKLNPSGTALAYATFLGGSSYECTYGIAVDSSGNAYVTGGTWSPDFPTTVEAFDTSCGTDGNCNNMRDAFVAKLNPAGTALAYATFLGGSDYDDGYGITVDGSGAAYVTGDTHSSDFPVTPGAFDTTYNGGGFDRGDAFVVKLNPSGSALSYATFLGGSRQDYGAGIAVDSSGAAYVTGETVSDDFPATPGAFDTTCSSPPWYYCNWSYDWDAFVVKLNPSGSALEYATFLGGHGSDGGTSIGVDASGAAYVTGGTYSGDFPITPWAFDTTLNGYKDAFVVKLNPSGSSLLYATFLGGSDYDLGHSLAVDPSGVVYVTGGTGSSDFPVTPGAFDTTYNGGPYESDAFVVKLRAGGGLSSDVVNFTAASCQQLPRQVRVRCD